MKAVPARDQGCKVVNEARRRSRASVSDILISGVDRPQQMNKTQTISGSTDVGRCTFFGGLLASSVALFCGLTLACLLTVPVFSAEPKAPSDLDIELVAIPAGTFMMGSPETERWRSNDPVTGEGPQTKVTVSKPFWLAKTETTRAQFEALMGKTEDPWSKKTAEDLAKAGADFGKYPAVNVTWDQAREFCAKLTARACGGAFAGRACLFVADEGAVGIRLPRGDDDEQLRGRQRRCGRHRVVCENDGPF